MTPQSGTSARKARSKRAKPTFEWPVDRATQYARDVNDGRIVAGPHVRNACKRHLNDLQRGAKRGLRWNPELATREIEFFEEVLRLNGGEHEGKPFIPEPWQAFVIGSLFGWLRADGYRRFRIAFVETGKGSGKSPLGAGIMLKLFVADNEARAEIYAAAVKKDQAMVLFRDAVAMVDQSPLLAARIEQSGGTGKVWNLAHLGSGSFFRPISTENQGKGQSGPRPHGAVLDEVHEHKTNAMVEFLLAGIKGRRQPMIVLITNSGVDRQTVCFEYHEHAIKVAAETVVDDSFFSYVCALDEEDDPFKDEDCWIKANPSLGVTFQKSYLQDQVRQARSMPAKESIVRRLNFCQWVDAASPWIDGDLWRACERDDDGPEAIDITALRERPCYLALDLSEKQDLTSLAAAWVAEDESLDAAVWSWTPRDTIAQREARDRVPYATWVTRGLLTAVPGRSVGYDFVARFVAELLGEHSDVRGLAFDQWHMVTFKNELDDLGVDNYVWEGPEGADGSGLRMVRHGQGYGGGGSNSILWMPRSIGSLEDVIITSRLRVKKNPVLTWNSASAVIEQDAQGNKKWEKRKSTGRIDGIVALCMAVGLALSAGTESDSVYEQRGVLVT